MRPRMIRLPVLPQFFMLSSLILPSGGLGDKNAAAELKEANQNGTNDSFWRVGFHTATPRFQIFPC